MTASFSQPVNSPTYSDVLISGDLSCVPWCVCILHKVQIQKPLPDHTLPSPSLRASLPKRLEDGGKQKNVENTKGSTKQEQTRGEAGALN